MQLTSKCRAASWLGRAFGTPYNPMYYLLCNDKEACTYLSTYMYMHESVGPCHYSVYSRPPTKKPDRQFDFSTSQVLSLNVRAIFLCIFTIFIFFLFYYEKRSAPCRPKAASHHATGSEIGSKLGAKSWSNHPPPPLMTGCDGV